MLQYILAAYFWFLFLSTTAVLFVWLVCGGFAINAGITALLN